VLAPDVPLAWGGVALPGVPVRGAAGVEVRLRGAEGPCCCGFGEGAISRGSIGVEDGGGWCCAGGVECMMCGDCW